MLNSETILKEQCYILLYIIFKTDMDNYVSKNRLIIKLHTNYFVLFEYNNINELADKLYGVPIICKHKGEAIASAFILYDSNDIH